MSTLSQRITALETQQRQVSSVNCIVLSAMAPCPEPVRAAFGGQALERDAGESVEAFKLRAEEWAMELTRDGGVAFLALIPGPPGEHAAVRAESSLAVEPRA